MKDTNKLNPEIRFSGFTDDWEQRKLREITSLITKGTTPKNKTGNGEINFIKVENIDSSSGEIKDYLKISIEEHEGYLKRSQLKENDILFSIAGTLGRTAVVNKRLLPANTNQALAILRTSEGDISYIITVLKGKAVSDFVRKNPTVGAQPNLSLEQVSNLEISYPSIDEQVKIGEFFSCIDNLITLHQRKLDKLKTLKKAMLEKMFPKNGESVPEIRFSGFTDDWEQRKLGEIADIIGGGTPSTSIDEYWDGDIDWYAPAEISDKIFVSSSERKITQEGYDNSSTKLLPIGTVLFTSRAGIGKTAILRKKGCTNQGFQSIVPHENELDSYFIYSRSEELKKYGETVGAGSTFVEVSGKQMANMNLLLPKSIEEQQKIGEYFSNLDHLITLHQRKLDKLKTLKKAMLEKMFI